MIAPGSTQLSSPVNYIIGFLAMGGPPAVVAYFRGRSIVGWTFLGMVTAVVVISLFPESKKSSGLAVIPALALAPIALLLLPSRRPRKPLKAAEPGDWSSNAPIGEDRRPRP